MALFGLLLIATATNGHAKLKKVDRSAGLLNDQVTFLNLINTAESIYFQSQGRYADFEELFRSGQMQQSSEQRPEYSTALTLLDQRNGSQLLGDFKSWRPRLIGCDSPNVEL